VKKERILIIEDEEDILEVLRYNLEREGFKVLAARDGLEGLRLARSKVPDLILLDLMLPGLDGLDLCRKLKEDPVTRSIRIIMSTAKAETSDQILGLGLGADDYVPKPFSTKALIARVRAVLRRGPLKEEADRRRIVRNDLVIDLSRHEVTIAGKPVPFTATELRLLHFLASHPGRVFRRSELVSRIISENAVVIERNIDVHVRSIRKKIGKLRDLLETVRGVGYRFKE